MPVPGSPQQPANSQRSTTEPLGLDTDPTITIGSFALQRRTSTTVVGHATNVRRTSTTLALKGLKDVNKLSIHPHTHIRPPTYPCAHSLHFTLSESHIANISHFLIIFFSLRPPLLLTLYRSTISEPIL